jgi:hypothetical protein
MVLILSHDLLLRFGEVALAGLLVLLLVSRVFLR